MTKSEKRAIENAIHGVTENYQMLSDAMKKDGRYSVARDFLSMAQAAVECELAVAVVMLGIEVDQ